MKRQIQLGVFVAVFILMHYYVISTLFNLFSLSKGLVFIIVIAILSISYPLASVIERKMPSKFSRAFYITAASWLGALFLLLILSALYDLTSVFIFIPKLEAGLVILALTSFLVSYSIVHSYHLNIRNITLHFDKEKLKKGFRLVHLTDIHLGTVNTRKFLEEVVGKTKQLKPDAVMMTGDLVDGSAPLTLEMLKPLEKIKAPIFFVIGNHEMYDGLDFVLPILRKTKMKIIRNSVTSWNGIQIAGIDYYESEAPAIKQINGLKINKNSFAILLNHAPTGFAAAEKKGFSLQLSGHTHNGQLFPFNLLVKLRYKFLTGLHKINNSFLFVSQGTGTWGPPMRLLTDSEIVVIELKRQKTSLKS